MAEIIQDPHLMITDNCPDYTTDNYDDTIAFLAPIPDQNSITQFKFQSFKFTADDTNQDPIDIECKITICDTDKGACDANQQCTAPTNRRRRFAQTEMEVTESHIVQARINVF